MFIPYAKDLARRLSAWSPRTVLEAAAGTGLATRELRAALPATTSIVATDLSEAMLAYAERSLGPQPALRWQQADLAALPFADASFAAVACQFGIMFVPDKAQMAREIRRVLEPGGRVCVSVWDKLAANPAARVVHQTVEALFPDNPPTFFALPFGYADHAVLHALFADHGFDDIHIDTVPQTAISVSARTLATGMICGSPMATALAERKADQAAVIDAVTAALAALGGAAPFRTPMQAVIVTARAV